MLNTVGAFLVVSLASPVYDLARLRNTQAAEPGSRLQWNSRWPCCRTSHHATPHIIMTVEACTQQAPAQAGSQPSFLLHEPIV